MIKNILKGLWKWIFWIFIILLLGSIILAIRIFVIDKDYGKAGVDEANGKSVSSTSSVTTTKNGNSFDIDSLKQSAVNGVKDIANATVKGYKGDSEYDYNAAYFDKRFLMYEGEQYEGAVKNVLENLIENSKDNFYARTSVTTSGFANNATVSYEGDVAKYQNAIKAIEDEVTSGKYEISFKYAGIMAYVNEIVITKK